MLTADFRLFCKCFYIYLVWYLFLDLFQLHKCTCLCTVVFIVIAEEARVNLWSEQDSSHALWIPQRCFWKTKSQQCPLTLTSLSLITFAAVHFCLTSSLNVIVSPIKWSTVWAFAAPVSLLPYVKKIRAPQFFCFNKCGNCECASKR